MSALRLITGTAITTLWCGTAFAEPAEAKLSANVGSLIAYARGGDIRVMSDQGAGVLDVNITNSAGNRDSAPSWGLPEENCFTPLNQPEDLAGGRTIVYESRPDGADSDIVLAKLKGYPPALDTTVNLTAAGNDDEGAPAVGIVFDVADDSPRPAVVFTRGPVGQRDIWAKFLDNSHETRLTDAPGDESNPDWSSDARSVVYETSDAGGRRQLAIIEVGYNSNGEHDSGVVVLNSPRFITSGTEHHGAPSWLGAAVIPDPLPVPDPESPAHSSRIVHVVTAFGATYLDFIEAPPATTTSGPLFAPASVPAPLVYQLTGDPGGDLAPSWHPHGTHATFDSDRAQPGNRDIYRIEANGSNLVRLTQNPAIDQAPDWELKGFGCLNPQPYSPRPGTQNRGPRSPGTAGTRPSGGTQKPSGNPKPSQAPLRISGLRVKKGGTGSRRFIVVRFVVNKAARGSLRLFSGRRVVARMLNRPLSAGRARIRLNVPRRVRGGRHRLRITVASGATRLTFHRNVRLASSRKRR